MGAADSQISAAAFAEPHCYSILLNPAALVSSYPLN